MPEKKRPTIPTKVKTELWARAAGRCEFRGCNKCLYKDQTTQRKRNMSEIAHIISWTPSGPRGNEHDSERLATDIDNLMLTCPEHNNLIDDPQYVSEYPVELLRQYKKEHEERVFRLTGLGQDYSIKIVEVISKIQGQIPQISESAELEAVLPYYPTEDKLRIDLTSTENIEEAKRIIDQQVQLHFSQEKYERVAAFIMSKIPYACYFGYAMGNKIDVESFQFFRDLQNWKWRPSLENTISCVLPLERKKVENVNLLVNISGIIDSSLIPDYPSYIIQASEPGFMFLQSREQVIEYRLKLREILDTIRYDHGENVIIHLFLAAPNPITFETGKNIMKNIDPSIVLYDKVHNGIEYVQFMELHKRVCTS